MGALPRNIPVSYVVDGLYISGWRATRFPDELREAGITNVLKLYPDYPNFPDNFNVFENALDDGEAIPDGVLERGVNFVLDCLDAGERVLIMCGAGISRSSTFVLAVMIARGYPVREAFHVLRAAHPDAAPHPAMWQSLIAHYDLDLTLREAIRSMYERDNA